MRLVGFRSGSARHIGRLDGDTVHDLGEVRAFYDACAEGRPPAETGKDWALGDLEQLPPVPETARIFCVGINYHEHADEAKDTSGIDLPKYPMIFGRWAQSLVVSGTPVPVPPNEAGLDWEVEMAAVIGRRTWLADRDNALESVYGYTAFNDLSARAKQADTLQFTLGKNADKSGPIGPVLVTADELPPGGAGLRVQARVNGEIMQDANTEDLIQDVAAIIEYITDTVTLLPGDVIATGTPGGVGFARNPPILLNAGDEVEVEVERIGVVRTPIEKH
ncbi:fumarylacetoacetate hydrolase family protein [Nocardia asiatica]|uniref:fumarylacetoacetate hydrolase family protein n=1 Tax=Nocardia asiatica TaxID=209252 RepID=UPI0002D4ED1D|nr:fumarylacetoacetate hydrolase family protein [Nocardia asiatica]